MRTTSNGFSKAITTSQSSYGRINNKQNVQQPVSKMTYKNQPLKPTLSKVLQSKKPVQPIVVMKQEPYRPPLVSTQNGFNKKQNVKMQTRPAQTVTNSNIFNKRPESGRQQQTTFRPMVVEQHLQQCKDCGRRFNQKALAKHEKICKKVFLQKRKEFNSAKQRIISKQQIAIKKKYAAKEEVYEKNTKTAIPKWKQDSMAFRIAMKQAKGLAMNESESIFIKNQKQVGSSDTKLCKFCNRRFNLTAAQRHIAFCEKKSKEMARKPTRR